MIRCTSCGHFLVAEEKKGHVYYRCHTTDCPTTCIREEAIDAAVQDSIKPFELTEQELAAAEADIEEMLASRALNAAAELRAVALNIARLDDRMSRLTDALVDRLIDRDAYLARKETVLHERAMYVSKKADLEAGADKFGPHAKGTLELVKVLGMKVFLGNPAQTTEILKLASSNFMASGKNVAITWRNPLQHLEKLPPVPSGEPYRDNSRTGRARQIAKIIMEHCAE
jgi:site-specific DNA recombinase